MPPDAHTLAERLRRDFERFSPAQQALARYLADNLPDVPLMSAHEVARAAHCSPATVVRFAQALGYAGYPEMQAIVRRAQRPGLLPRSPSNGSASGLAADLAAERSALDVAVERLDDLGVAPIAAAFAGRSPLVLAGEGYAAPIVTLMSERLARAGRPALRIEALDPATRGALEALPAGAAVLAVGLGRETRVAEAAVAAARVAGAPAATLVDSALSPLARGPLARVVPAEPREGGPTLVAMVAVAQALSHALAPVTAADAPRMAAVSA